MNAIGMHAQYLRSSQKPRAILERLAYSTQAQHLRNYAPGYEHYMDMLPVLAPDDPQLGLKLHVSSSVVKALAQDLIDHAPWIQEHLNAGEFRRTIIAVQEPAVELTEESEDETLGRLRMWSETPTEIRKSQSVHEGPELLVAQWGVGFTSPVHGHASGLLHEDILYGEILVNSYRWVRDGVVRLVRSDLARKGTLVSDYAAPDERGKRMGLIHNFIAVEPSASLHYVAEHTRDGRDNGFEVEHFNYNNPITSDDVLQIDGNEGRRMQIGDIALVRSANVPQYGDHYIVVTGRPVVKDHGLRPQDVAIQAPPSIAALLDQYQSTTGGLVLLKLKPAMAAAFRAFHGIKIEGGRVIFQAA